MNIKNRGLKHHFLGLEIKSADYSLVITYRHEPREQRKTQQKFLIILKRLLTHWRSRHLKLLKNDCWLAPLLALLFCQAKHWLARLIKNSPFPFDKWITYLLGTVFSYNQTMKNACERKVEKAFYLKMLYVSKVLKGLTRITSEVEMCYKYYHASRKKCTSSQNCSKRFPQILIRKTSITDQNVFTKNTTRFILLKFGIYRFQW